MNPDIHAMNLLRSSWAGAALDTFVEHTSSDRRSILEAIHDLIADLGHFAELEGYDFHDIVERAFGTWLLERSGLETLGAKRPAILIEIGGAA